MKNFKGTFIFSLVVFLVVGFAVYEYKKIQKEELQDELSGRILGSLESYDIQEVEYTGELSSFKISRADFGWKLLAPIEARADEAEVESFFSGLLGMPVSEVEAEGEDINWDDYGFSNPAANFKITNKEGKVFEFSLGSVRTFEDGYYLRRGDEEQLLIGDKSWASFVNRTSLEFRNRDLFPMGSEVQSIEIKTPRLGRESLKFSRTDGLWKLESNTQMRLDEIALENYISKVRHLRADSIVSEEKSNNLLSQYGLNRPGYVFKVNLENEQGLWNSQISSEKEGRVYVAVDDINVIYQMSADKMTDLNQDLTYFMNKSFPFEFDQLAAYKLHLRLKEEPTEFRFIKNSEGWEIDADNPHQKLDQNEVVEFLNLIRSLEAHSFVNKSAEINKSLNDNQLVLFDQFSRRGFEMSWGGSQSVGNDNYVYVLTNMSEKVSLVAEEDILELTSRKFILSGEVPLEESAQ